MQQSQDLARARQQSEQILGGKVEIPAKELKPDSKTDSKPNSEKARSSPTKSNLDIMAHFSEPPMPPPQAPLPEKPDVARALADPIIRPLLRRDDTALSSPNASSPTRPDHSSDILRLCEELKLAKGEISNQSERMRNLEHELAQERSARESAEERALRFERRDSPTKDGERYIDTADEAISPTSPPDLQSQLDRLRATMDEMKLQMESYRQRAETAETDRDEARSSLAEMVELKRREMAEASSSQSGPGSPKSPKKSPLLNGSFPQLNGHAPGPRSDRSGTETILERAGVEEGQPINAEQARALTELLTQEVLRPQGTSNGDSALAYYGQPYGSAAAVVLLGMLVMTWVNGWPKVER